MCLLMENKKAEFNKIKIKVLKVLKKYGIKDLVHYEQTGDIRQGFIYKTVPHICPIEFTNLIGSRLIIPRKGNQANHNRMSVKISANFLIKSLNIYDFFYWFRPFGSYKSGHFQCPIIV